MYLDDFVDNLQEKSVIDMFALFSNNNNFGNNEDKLITFIDYMLANCIIRHATGYKSGTVYQFSKPGRKILKDKIRRDEFIQKFIKFYN